MLPTGYFFTLVTGPRRALSLLKLSDTRVYEPEIRTRLGYGHDAHNLLGRLTTRAASPPPPR